MLAARSQTATPVSLTAGWSGRHADELIHTLEELHPPAAAVMGVTESVRALRMPAPVFARRDERLFRLERLVLPSGVDGSPRLAVDADRHTVTAWLHASDSSHSATSRPTTTPTPNSFSGGRSCGFGSGKHRTVHR